MKYRDFCVSYFCYKFQGYFLCSWTHIEVVDWRDIPISVAVVVTPPIHEKQPDLLHCQLTLLTYAVHCLSTDSRRLAITHTTVNCHTTNDTFRHSPMTPSDAPCVLSERKFNVYAIILQSNTTSWTTVSIVGKAVTVTIKVSVHSSSTAELPSYWNLTLSQGAKISSRWVRASSETVAADLPHSLRARVGMPAETGYDRYLSYPFQFIKHHKVCAF